MPPSFSPSLTPREFARLRSIILLLVVVLLVFSGLVTAWNIWSDYEQRVAAQERQSLSMVSALEEHAARTFGEADRVLISAMDTIQAKGGLSAWDERSLHEMLSAKIKLSPTPQVRDFYVANQTGLVVGNTATYPIRTITVADRAYFRHHAASPATDTFISQPFKNKLNQQWRIGLSRRLNNPDGTFAGLVGLDLDPQYFDSLYSKLDIGLQGKITLIQRDGPVLMQTPFSEAAMTFNFNKEPLLTTYLPKAAWGTFYNPTAGVNDSNYIASYRTLDEYPIVAVVFLLIDEILAPWKAYMVKQLVVTALMMLLGLVLSYLLLRRLKELELASVQIVSQEEELRSAHGKLQQAYNETEAKVQERTVDLKLLTQNLEEEIIERKRAEEALRKSGVWHRTILRTAMDGIWLVDLQGRLLEVNDAYCRMSGYNEQELLTMSISDIEANEMPTDIAAHVHKIITQGEDRFETRHRCKDGSILEVEVSSQYKPTEGGLLVSFIRDITERKRAEEELRESEERYRTLIQTSMDGVWMVDLQGRLLQVNESYCRMSGYSEAELLNMHICDVEAIMTMDDVFTHTQNIITAGNIRFESKHRHKNGTLYDVEVSAQNIPLSEGHIAVFLRDITDRKQVEEALRESEEIFRNLFNNTEIAMFRTRLDGSEVLNVNEKFLELIGRTREEVIGKPSVDYWVDPHQREEMVRKLKANGRVVGLEFRMLNKKGEVRDCITSLNLYPEEGILDGSILDVTERKRAEEELANVNMTLETALEHSPVPMVLVSMPDAVLRIVNTACREFLGIMDEPPPAGQTLMEIKPTYQDYDDRGYLTPLAEAPLALAIKGQKTLNQERRIVSKDGTTHWALVSGNPIYNTQGDLIAAFLVFPDITERKRAEEEKEKLEAQLLQAQKMEAIGTLAGGIAHDFNNILWAIMGFTELTLHSIPAESRERHNLQKVLQASERAKDLVNQILAFSRKTDREKKPLQISLIVKEAIKLLRATIPTTIEIQQNIASPNAMVLADPTQIHQIIINLSTNAIHEMREQGGVLEVKLEECYLDNNFLMKHYDLTPGYYVMLTIRDTGHGIDQKILDRIFEPFFTTKGVGEGTGMGLAVVHGIVKSHGGDITVSSQPGEGTTFTVFLPKIVSEEKSTAEVLAPIPKGTGRVLVIDDEKVLIDLHKEMLESLGYDAVSLNSSIEALKIFQAQPEKFDLVITDQTMPHMTGMQLSQELRRIRLDIPIILCTGYSETASEEKVKAAGIDELLMKPINLRNLAETIKKVIDNQ
jgi:PAS domain S-box-containing protein